MADTEFITARFPDAAVPRTQTKRQAQRRVHRFIPPGSRARIREQGGEFGPWRSERETVDRLDARMDRMGVGPKLIVQRESDRDQLSIREVKAEPLIPDLHAAPEIEKIHAAVWAEFDVRSGGLYLCRYIDGTRSVSKHGYVSSTWKGAAEDIFVLSGGMTQLVRVGEFIVNGTKAGKLKAATVIVDTKIWTPGTGWRPYGGNRHFHVHADCVGGHPCTPG